MPNGDITLLDFREMRVLFLDAQDVSASSPWVEMGAYHNKSFHVNAIEAGGTIEIMVRNDETQPAAGTDGEVEVTMVNAGALGGASNSAYRWWKAKKTAGGAPAASTLRSNANRAGR